MALKDKFNRIFGGPVAQRSVPVLPAVVVKLIQEQEQCSERLIAFLQCCLIIFFAVFYALSAKTSAGTPFLPVPWVLCFYAGFAVLRLYRSWAELLSPFWVYGSIILDMFLLMIMIWSFHLQYGQPAAFYLKAPSLLYVFIFISLRALRFNPRYVLAAGAAAVVGWFSLLLYALWEQDMNMEMLVTHDFVKYMTANYILIGAEVDKIVSIIVVTMLLALALHRARNMLTGAVADNLTATELRRFVAPELAQRVREGNIDFTPGRHERHFASIIFTDVEGFSSLSQRRSPEDTALTLSDYLNCVLQIIERRGGGVAQIIGDAVLVTFNSTRPDPHHAQNAVLTALEIVQVTQAETFGPHNDVMLTRCGVNTGTVMAGAFGSNHRMIFTVHGDEVNVASRLEALNKEHGTYLLMSEKTVTALPEILPGIRDRLEPLGCPTIRGREGETCIYTLPWQDMDVKALSPSL